MQFSLKATFCDNLFILYTKVLPVSISYDAQEDNIRIAVKKVVQWGGVGGWGVGGGKAIRPIIKVI